MPPSEIDLIFSSSKGKRPVSSPSSSASAPVPSAPAPSLTAPKQKKKKDKKRKRDDADVNIDAAPAASSSSVSKAKRPAVETILDPSARLSTLPASSAKRLKASSKPSPAAPPPPKSSSKTKAPKDDDDARFKDSRGTGPRRKTEEGFAIYKEDELGIQDAGGDTPLCPFDCDCCF